MYLAFLSYRCMALSHKSFLIAIDDFLYGLLKSFPLILEKAFNITIEAFAVVILALYITYDPSFFTIGLLGLTSHRHHQRMRHILETMRSRLEGWMSRTFLAMLFLGVGVGIGLWLLGIPLSLPFAIVAALFEVIPIISSFIRGFLPALVALTISPIKLLLVLALFITLNQINAHIFQPIVVGQQVHLHLIAVLIMSKLLGIISLIFAIPAAVVVGTLFNEFTDKPSLAKSAVVGKEIYSGKFE